MTPRNAETKNCAIKGCNLAQRRGLLCSKHHALVPLSDTMACMSDVMVASARAAAKHHRKWLRDVRARIASGEAV